MKAVTIKNFSQLSGYTEKAVRNKIYRGIWVKNIHYSKSREAQITINLSDIESWIQGADAL